MKKNFAFISLSETIKTVIALPREAKEKQSPFIVVNTDNNRGLYIQKLEREIAKYKGLVGDTDLRGIKTDNLIVFGDSHKYDYRIEMNYVTLNTLFGRDVKVYDIVSDFSKVVRRLEKYARTNGIKTKHSAVVECCAGDSVRIDVRVSEDKVKSGRCPFVKECAPVVKKTLVNIYERPNFSVEKVTVFHNWVKIGYRQYDIFIDMCGEEFIILEDGEKLFVKTDRFGRRYLATQ